VVVHRRARRERSDCPSCVQVAARAEERGEPPLPGERGDDRARVGRRVVGDRDPATTRPSVWSGPGPPSPACPARSVTRALLANASLLDAAALAAIDTDGGAGGQRVYPVKAAAIVGGGGNEFVTVIVAEAPASSSGMTRTCWLETHAISSAFVVAQP